MKSIKYLLLCVFVVFSCDAQINDASNNILPRNKTNYYAQDYYTIVVIGDSNADGSAHTNTTCAANTLIKWNVTNSALDEITTQSSANYPTAVTGGFAGSIWQPFATAYKAAYGKPVLLINAARGGSSFWSSTYSWYTTGTLYSDMITQTTAALAATGETVDLVIVNCGINDVRASFSLASITTGVSSLISRLEASFPGKPKLFMQIGRTETDVNSTDLYNAREMLVDQVQANTNCYLIGSPPVLALLSGYESDGVHYNQYTDGVLAQNIVNWISNSSYSKWGRSVISGLFSTPSSTRKTLIDNLVSAQVTSGNYFRMDEWHVFKTDNVNDLYVDWTMIGYASLRTASFSSNDAISFNGSTYSDLAYVSAHQAKRSTQNNILVGANIKTRSGTNTSYVFGSYDGSKGTGLAQLVSPTPITSIVNNGTFLAGTDILLQAGNLYTIGRSGTTQKLYKNTTTQTTATQASTGTHIYNISLGTVNNTGARTVFLACSIDWAFVSEHDSFDLTGLYNDMGTYISSYVP